MSDTSTGFDFGEFLNDITPLAKSIATPFVEKLAYGEDNATALEMQRERNAYASLNGSGPNDRSGALNASLKDSIRNFLFGTPGNTALTNDKTPSATISGGMIAIGVGLVLVLFFILKRR